MNFITSGLKMLQKIIRWFIRASLKIKSVVIIIVLVLIWIAYSQIISAQTKPQYQTAQVTRGTILSTVTESGNVASISQATVGSPTTGIIKAIFVKDGDYVTSGENLFQVKSTATAQEIASAWSNYQNAVITANNVVTGKISAQATLEKDRQAVINAAIDVTTMQNNLSIGAVNPSTKQSYTQNDIDSINSALTSARETFSADEKKYLEEDQAISSANAAQNSAWLAYEATQDSIVTAPINGIVANIGVEVGDSVAASSGNLSSELTNSSSSSSNNPILSIGNFSSPYIKVPASEVDVPNIHPSQSVTVTLDAFTGETFVGIVRQVDTIGTNSSGVITYNVFVDLVSPPKNIMPGMSATVTIETARKDNVLKVPSSAVQTQNGTTTVRVLQNGKLTSVPVTTGLTSDTETEITSGLSEGQTVVTSVISSTTGGTSSLSPFSGLRGGFGGGFGGGGNRVINRGDGG